MKPAPYTFYKGKAALRVTIIPAKEVQNGQYTNTEPGMILLEIAPAKGKQSYDWDKKIVFSLNPAEVASIEVNRLSKKATSLFHDPNMKSDKQGQVTKSLKINSVQNGGYAFNFLESNNGTKHNVSIVLSASEYYLFRMLIENGVLRTLGW
ncbi:MAG: hypothetical protein ACTSPB_24745 [Candidatus Thorarchaeota archaeon]